MDIKETFLKATEYLIPFKQENRMEPLLPKNIQKDAIGNYYTIVGESKSMFCCHLDSYTRMLTKVDHVIYDDGKKVKTKGFTPLGADAKAGMVIMLNMIEHNVPGCYYFFIGEEGFADGGVYGSKNIFKKNPDFFKQFDRCISFDRKGYGSIITKMKDGPCCSKEFCGALMVQFTKNGMEYKADASGFYTDSAVFVGEISEVTNLSCGGFEEHRFTEWQDLEYLEKLADVCCKINWEDLPKVRKPEAPKEYTKKIDNDYVDLWWGKQKKTVDIDDDKKKKKSLSSDVDVPDYVYYVNDKKRKKSKESKKKGGGLFNFDGFTKKRGVELYRQIRGYFEYYGFKEMHVLYGKQEGFDIYGLLKNPKNLKEVRLGVIGTKISISFGGYKSPETVYNSLAEFEKKMNVGFDAKFAQYADEFVDDLQEYKKLQIIKAAKDQGMFSNLFGEMDSMTIKVPYYQVEKMLRRYGDFKVSDLLKYYDKLFDEDDFEVRKGCIYI